MEEDLFQDKEYELHLLASVIIIGAEIGHQTQINNCYKNQLYLTGSELLPNPHHATL